MRRGRDPAAPGPLWATGPASQIHLCAARPRCSGSLCSSSPTGLLAVPRTRPLSPPPGFGSRHLFPSGMSFLPSVQIISLQGPCPQASSTTPVSRPPTPPPPAPLPGLSLRGCAQGRLPGQAVHAGRAGAVGTGTLCGFFLPRLSLGVGAPCLEGLHAFPACDSSCPCSQAGWTVTQTNPLRSGPLLLVPWPGRSIS